MFDQLITQFKKIAPPVDYWSIRLLDEQVEHICVRQGVMQPFQQSQNRGAMIEVLNGNGFGYAATSDLTASGLLNAVNTANKWATFSQNHHLIDSSKIPRNNQTGSYQSPVKIPWDSNSLAEKIELLQGANTQLKLDDRIVDWQADLTYKHTHILLSTSEGGRIEQTFEYVIPNLVAVANQGLITQRRTGGGSHAGRQGGLEQLQQLDFPQAANQVSEEAIALLDAGNCPSDNMDILVMPDQMVLQIHESIGHPLELDRILGDERNYAGTSFVTLDMFGNYQYGSPLLNVTFDPSRSEQFASYGFDDDGSKATKTYVIKDGILVKPLGGASSQSRVSMNGVANARACSWNRPTIDRMANLNLEPGDSSFEDMISGIEKGILMQTNCSWSIDDSRNKFQFGCELGRVIEDGELKELVRNPNYRGVSASFWQNLSKVGSEHTFEVLGTPFCGKGEPNQMVHVGHASPACVFCNVEVFGGSE